MRLFAKAGAEVKVVMTEAAKDFVTPLTLSTLSNHPVFSAFQRDEDTGEWTNHVELGMWADLMVIAPLSANTLAKMATGRCDNLLMAVYLSAKCPVMVAPAMDLDMYQHPTTTENLVKLRQFGNIILEARSGELASGLVGQGRMEEPEEILEQVITHFADSAVFNGKKILITAGPTHERLDPVRFIGNYSSGKMGFALAEQLAGMGAHVLLVSGPTALSAHHPNIELTRVVSADEMYTACIEKFEHCEIAVLSAAVADFKPKYRADDKLKKSSGLHNLELEPTVDILASLGERKQPGQLLVGFALETSNELENAMDKLRRKNLDLIVLNSLRDPGAGFAHDTNKVTLVDRENNISRFELKDKREVARDIAMRIKELSVK
ncbi:MAG: bifunctional phosphopantothenoylcysteine decarboxylase/phosphopantothenate--cysteine ligase CoaBC [Bacteroidota bacterium]